MKKTKLTLVAALMLWVVAAQAQAQEPGMNVRHARVFDPPPAAVYLPPPPAPSLVFTYRPHFRDRYDHRPHYRPSERCREVVTVERRHGRYREVIRTVCRERDRWRDGHRDWRDGHRDWRGDRRDHWRGDHRRDRERW